MFIIHNFLYSWKHVHICRYTCICRCSTTSSQVIAVCLTPGDWETLAHKDQHMKLLMTECVSNQPIHWIYPLPPSNSGKWRPIQICYLKNLMSSWVVFNFSYQNATCSPWLQIRFKNDLGTDPRRLATSLPGRSGELVCRIGPVIVPQWDAWWFFFGLFTARKTLFVWIVWGG